MIGLYPPAMLRKYIQEQCHIPSGTYVYHQTRLPQPTTVGPGGTAYFTEVEVVTHLTFWREHYQRYGRKAVSTAS